MKRNFVILSLLSLMPFLGASESMQVDSGSMPMVPEYQWYDASMTDAQIAFDDYLTFVVKKIKEIEEQKEAGLEVSDSGAIESETLGFRLITTLGNTIRGILDQNPNSAPFGVLVPDYCNYVLAASLNIKDLEQYRSYLEDSNAARGVDRKTPILSTHSPIDEC